MEIQFTGLNGTVTSSPKYKLVPTELVKNLFTISNFLFFSWMPKVSMKLSLSKYSYNSFWNLTISEDYMYKFVLFSNNLNWNTICYFTPKNFQMVFNNCEFLNLEIFFGGSKRHFWISFCRYLLQKICESEWEWLNIRNHCFCRERIRCMSGFTSSAWISLFKSFYPS